MHRNVIGLLLALTLASAACAGDEATGNGADSPSPSSSTTVASPAADLCQALSAEPYEARKQALADAGDAVDEAPCQPLIDELEAAMAVEERAAGIDETAVALELGCASSYIEATVVNSTPEPIGFAGALTRHPAGQREDVRAGTEVVEWRIEAGQRLETERALRWADVDSCGARAQVFLADDGPHDASLPGEAADDDLAADDPRVWFPALIAAEKDWREKGDPEGVALTEDIRSIHYRGLVAGAIEGQPEGPERPGKLTVCRNFFGPDDRWTAVYYRADRGAHTYTDDAGAVVELPAESTTDLGVFRRGGDGRWRWLIRSVTIEHSPCDPFPLMEMPGDSDRAG